MQKKKIAVIGMYVTDLMTRSPHVPVAGETVKGTSFTMGLGGKASNQALAAARLGGDVKLITKIGRDSLGQKAEEIWKKDGIFSEGVLHDEENPTGSALVMVDEGTGVNQIVIYAGPSDNITDEDLDSVGHIIDESAFLLCQLECNMSANYYAMRRAKKAGAMVILNTAPYSPIPDDMLAMVDMVTPNEVEAAGLAGMDSAVTPENAEEAADRIMAKGIKVVVITLGANGAFVKTESESRLIPPVKVNAIDTTGAGDTFNGALVKAMADGLDIFEAAEYANIAAGISTERIGSGQAIPYAADVEDYINNRLGK